MGKYNIIAFYGDICYNPLYNIFVWRMLMINLITFIFPIFFFLIFALSFGIFIFSFARGVKEWNKNNNSPRLTVDATIVAKRTYSHRHNHRHDHHVHTTYSNTYYATFQFESGDRLELPIPSNEIGLLAEGDVGKLTFQGTRFLSFERV